MKYLEDVVAEIERGELEVNPKKLMALTNIISIQVNGVIVYRKDKSTGEVFNDNRR